MTEAAIENDEYLATCRIRRHLRRARALLQRSDAARHVGCAVWRARLESRKKSTNAWEWLGKLEVMRSSGSWVVMITWMQGSGAALGASGKAAEMEA